MSVPARRKAPAKPAIVVYTVNCPDCGRTGRIAVEGEAAMDLGQLYCPDCDPGSPPMEVLKRSHHGTGWETVA